jgi:hypothetical protein
MDSDRLLMRLSPFAGLGGLSWLAYRVMTARLFKFWDLVAITTLLVVLWEMHSIVRVLARMDDGR